MHGGERVARNLLHFWGSGTTLVSLPAAGQPAVLGFISRRLAAVLLLGMRAGLIESVQVIADPQTLGFVASQLEDVTI